MKAVSTDKPLIPTTTVPSSSPAPAGRVRVRTAASGPGAARRARAPWSTGRPAGRCLRSAAGILRVNPLAGAAAGLLALAGQLRHSVAHNDVPGLRRRLIEEIKRFESAAQARGIRPEVVITARYIFCAVLDGWCSARRGAARANGATRAC